MDNDPGFAKTYIREKAEVLKHLTHGDGELYVRAARKRKMKLSEWMTETCDTASGLVTPNVES